MHYIGNQQTSNISHHNVMTPSTAAKESHTPSLSKCNELVQQSRKPIYDLENWVVIFKREDTSMKTST